METKYNLFIGRKKHREETCTPVEFTMNARWAMSNTF